LYLHLISTLLGRHALRLHMVLCQVQLRVHLHLARWHVQVRIELLLRHSLTVRTIMHEACWIVMRSSTPANMFGVCWRHLGSTMVGRVGIGRCCRYALRSTCLRKIELLYRWRWGGGRRRCCLQVLKRCWRVRKMRRAIAIRVITRIWYLTRCLRSRAWQGTWSLPRRSPKAVFSLSFGRYYRVDLIGGIVECR
jgi:hypothetical protein